MEKVYRTYCFKCHAKRRIIDYKWRVTANLRRLCEGKCIECKGKVALMSGYAELPENIYTYNNKDGSKDDSEE